MERPDYQAASIAAMIATVNRDTEAHPDSYSPLDFLPEPEPVAEEEPVPVWKQQLAAVEILNAALGGADLRER
jgi:hypothetical protein